MGVTDVILLERHKLSSGSTWHAAGLVGQLRSSANVTRLLGYSVALYDRLEAETGLATGWKMNGGLRLACTPERWTEVRRQATTARSFGLEMQLLTPAEAQALWPLMTVDDVIGAAYLPTDGQASPSDIVQALARGARTGGVTIREDTAVTAIRVENGRVKGVVTDRGEIACDTVVNCAGQWAREVGRLAGVNVPLVSVQHQYLITDRIEGVTPDLPTLRDPDRLTYYKEEVGGLVMGGYEPNPKPWAEAGIPDGFHFTLLDGDLDHFEPMMRLALGRVPALETAGVKEFINGPESFTPDGNFILGEAPEVAGFFVGAGFNAFGIASGGGAGMALAEWIVHGAPPYDLWPVDIRRFGPNHLSTAWVRARTLEAYGRHYAMAWPHEEYASARPLRRSPLYDRLRAKGAAFGEKLGWERPNWFARPGETPEDVPTFGRPNWFEAVAREHRACREAAALFDQTSFAKFMLTGRDAEAALSWIAANDVTRPPGALTYTQMLNAARRDRVRPHPRPPRRRRVLHRHRHRLRHPRLRLDPPQHPRRPRRPPDRRHLPPCGAVADGTARARHPRPRHRGRHIEPGVSVRHRAPADRRGRAGDRAPHHLRGRARLGAARPGRVRRDRLRRADGGGRGRRAGRRRLPGDRIAAAGKGLSRLGRGDRPRSLAAGGGPRLRGEAAQDHAAFLGRDALEAQRAGRLPRMLAGFALEDPEVMLHGRETIFRDGARVGWLASGGFGHTVGRPLGYGYVRDPDNGVDAGSVLAGSYEIEVATERYPAEVFLAPPYDPEMLRVRG